MMKKLLLTAILIAAFSLTACAKTENNGSSSAYVEASTSTETAALSAETTVSPETTAAPVTTIEASETEADAKTLTLDEFKNTFNDSSVFAVALIGCSEQETAESVKEYVKSSAIAEKYSFINDISSESIVFAGGTEIYCVIPSDGVTELTVSAALYDDEGTISKGNSIFSGDNKPILLVCNTSDIMANSIITAVKGDSVKEYSPSVSLRDGSLYIPEGETEILDFSEYNFEAE